MEMRLIVRINTECTDFINYDNSVIDQFNFDSCAVKKSLLVYSAAPCFYESHCCDMRLCGVLQQLSVFNSINEKSNKNRDEYWNKWQDAREKFMSKHIPR